MACVCSRYADVHVAPESIVLLTPDGGFNRGSVVGKRVPGTWSGVLDVFVFCVDDVRSSRHTDPGRAPGGDTIYRDTLPRDGPATPGAPWRRQWRSGSRGRSSSRELQETQR
jgi:hypothetical protein